MSWSTGCLRMACGTSIMISRWGCVLSSVRINTRLQGRSRLLGISELYELQPVLQSLLYICLPPKLCIFGNKLLFLLGFLCHPEQWTWNSSSRQWRICLRNYSCVYMILMHQKTLFCMRHRHFSTWYQFQTFIVSQVEISSGRGKPPVVVDKDESLAKVIQQSSESMDYL